jgi:hypothetical protein
MISEAQNGFREKKSINKSNNKLRSYLLQNCFYSLQEFFLTMIDGSLVIQYDTEVCGWSLDCYRHQMCEPLFYVVNLCFWRLKYIYCFILNCWELSSMVGKL